MIGQIGDVKFAAENGYAGWLHLIFFANGGDEITGGIINENLGATGIGHVDGTVRVSSDVYRSFHGSLPLGLEVMDFPFDQIGDGNVGGLGVANVDLTLLDTQAIRFPDGAVNFFFAHEEIV